MDAYPYARESLAVDALLPGKGYQLIDDKQAYNKRQNQIFTSEKQEYRESQTVSIQCSADALLDPARSFIQALVTIPQQQPDGVTEITEEYVFDQGCPWVRRVQVKVKNIIILDMDQFHIYLKIVRGAYGCNKPEMNCFDIGDTATFAFDKPQAGVTTVNQLIQETEDVGAVYFTALTKKLANYDAIGQKQYDYLLRHRGIEDMKSARKYYRWESADNNFGYDPITDTDVQTGDNKTLLFYLNELPCFSEMLFPMYLVEGSIQINFDLEVGKNCVHLIDPKANIAHNAMPQVNYKMNRVELSASLVFPTQEYINQQKIDAANNLIHYKGQWVEQARRTHDMASQHILFNSSSNRLARCFFVKRHLEIPQELSTRRTSTEMTYPSRGYAWFSPWTDIRQLSLRVGGLSYPQSEGSTIVDEPSLLAWTKNQLGVNQYPMGKDQNRFFLDYQVLAFDFKTSRSMHSLQQISGINTRYSSQIQLSISTYENPTAGTEISAFLLSEQVIHFLAGSEVRLYR